MLFGGYDYTNTYEVLEKIRENAYRIDLPPSIKVYKILNTSKLRKVTNNPLLS